MASQIREDEKLNESGRVKPEPKLDDSWYYSWTTAHAITKGILVLLLITVLYGIYSGIIWIISLI